MTTLDKIFDVWYGVNLEVVNSEVVERGIPFVSRQAVDNGVVCHVRKIEGVTPNPAHTLSIAVSGSVLSTFYHDCEYYSGRDVYVAKPKEPMTREEMLYYAVIIEANKYKYNYGRGANKTFRNIIVPEKHELPKYVNTYKAEPSFSEASIINKKYEINTRDWKWFIIKDICDYPYKAKAYNANELIDCPNNVPNAILYVTRTDINNGCKGSVINDGFDAIERGNAITIGDTTSTIFYQNEDFICGDHIVVLRSKFFNIHTGLFITALLNKERFRYNYGRAFTMDIIAKTRIKLPAIKDIQGNWRPNWKFMEDYIKSLPYSVNLEINEKAKLLNEIETYKHKVAALETQLQAQQSGSLVNYGTVNIYEK